MYMFLMLLVFSCFYSTLRNRSFLFFYLRKAGNVYVINFNAIGVLMLCRT